LAKANSILLVFVADKTIGSMETGSVIEFIILGPVWDLSRSVLVRRHLTVFTLPSLTTLPLDILAVYSLSVLNVIALLKMPYIIYFVQLYLCKVFIQSFV
jgi:hypothetical protein